MVLQVVPFEFNAGILAIRNDFEKLRSRRHISEPVLGTTHLEGGLAAFENFLDQFSDRLDVDRPHMFRRHPRVALLRFSGRGEAENQFGVTENRDVRVVRREHELPLPFFLPHDRHDAFGYETVVEVVFGLIDHQRRFGFE